ncbi:MAG: isocitrate lyase/phosphoenolpyruvate mutase family protein [Acidimicrobiales bacterium]|nr:isocitrate lyase/phosphoenolpyruvate mutase family protein [Acidimicrobiales bacterium]
MDHTARFRALHERGFFVMPNAWDVGSAVRLEQLGFPSIATTSAGHAVSLGKRDQQLTFDEVCDHVARVASAVSIPVSVDSERLFATTPDGVAENVNILAGLGAAGVSIEDYDPARGAIDPVEHAADRVEAAADAAYMHGMILTARAENHLYGAGDLDDTINRLLIYARAGARCVYAPGLTDLAEIAEVVDAVDVAVNVLLLPEGPGPSLLADLGARRASTGGSLARTAYGAMERAAATFLTDVGPPWDERSP